MRTIQHNHPIAIELSESIDQFNHAAKAHADWNFGLYPQSFEICKVAPKGWQRMVDAAAAYVSQLYDIRKVGDRFAMFDQPDFHGENLMLGPLDRWGEMNGVYARRINLRSPFRPYGLRVKVGFPVDQVRRPVIMPRWTRILFDLGMEFEGTGEDAPAFVTTPYPIVASAGCWRGYEP